jgi:membrane protease YdiL (CAAX protease family)
MADPPPPEPSEPPVVPIWVPFVALFAVLLVVNLFGAVVLGLVAANDPSIEDFGDAPEGARIGLTLFQDVVFVAGAWIAVKLALGRTPPEAFGLRRVVGVAQAIGWSAAVYIGFWIVIVGLTQIFGQPDDQSLVDELKAEDSLGVLVAWGVLICVLAPIVEELFFRGFMFAVLERRLGVAWGALITGVVFGIGHLDQQVEPVQLIALGAFGVGLCLLYWRTQSIIPCMALHALNNSITFGVVTELPEDSPALFAGVVLASVGTVIAGATVVSARGKVAA